MIAKDRYGNKYYENLEEELPRTNPGEARIGTNAYDEIVRTRWVDYKDAEFDP